MFDRYCLGVDVSSWQASIDWQTLKVAGVEFAVVKASQGSYRQDPLFGSHIKGAAKAGMICAAYHWLDPGCPVDAQISNLKQGLRGLPFAFIALDVEQYWCDWQEWQQGSISGRYSGEQISRSAQGCAAAMESAFGKPVVVYTRASFVRDYAPQMSAWLPAYPLWLAYYPYKSGKVRLTWEKMLREYAPAIPAPAIPPGCSDWRLWQFSGDKFILPGAQTALDLNFFNGSLQDMQVWLGQPITPHQPSDKEKLAALWQAHPELWQEVSDAKKET